MTKPVIEDPAQTCAPLLFSHGEAFPVVSCATSKPISAFLWAVENHLIAHPEYTSSNIQRADVSLCSEDEVTADFTVRGFGSEKIFKRLLRPSRSFDRSLEQHCVFYSSLPLESEGGDRLIVFFPSLSVLPLPFYHPQVSLIAFHFANGRLTIFLAALPGERLPNPLPKHHKLYRTSLRLIQALYSVMDSWTETGTTYQKRVYHDLLVEREISMDRYLEMKDRYTWLLQGNLWEETIGTDPNKHVWEDVGIACWLVNLLDTISTITDKKRKQFVDVGCGNGLLVHVLQNEGYSCMGFDLAARKLWPHFPPPTPSKLHTVVLDPPAFVLSCLSPSSPSAGSIPSIGNLPLPSSPFLIGNHADELTPWIPLMTAAIDEAEEDSSSTPLSSQLDGNNRPSEEGFKGEGRERAIFIIIPCCFHELNGRFTRMDYKIEAPFLHSLCPTSAATCAGTSNEPHPLLQAFRAPTPQMFDILEGGGLASRGGRYAAYQLYLADICLRAGYVPEREALRIGSTKNLGIVGRKRIWEVTTMSAQEGRSRVKEEVLSMVARSKGWKAREKQGKDH
ncbi:DUF1613-domain-containing protein [Atractiella rhizophila]|nr:DUF1613-domain-containing protein [Atractiella rhizophila]